MLNIIPTRHQRCHCEPLDSMAVESYRVIQNRTLWFSPLWRREDYLHTPRTSTWLFKMLSIHNFNPPMTNALVLAPSPCPHATRTISTPPILETCTILNSNIRWVASWDFSLYSAVHTVLPAVLLFPWMLWEIIESAEYAAVCCGAPTSTRLVNTVSPKRPAVSRRLGVPRKSETSTVT